MSRTLTSFGLAQTRPHFKTLPQCVKPRLRQVSAKGQKRTAISYVVVSQDVGLDGMFGVRAVRNDPEEIGRAHV